MFYHVNPVTVVKEDGPTALLHLPWPRPSLFPAPLVALLLDVEQLSSQHVVSPRPGSMWGIVVVPRQHVRPLLMALAAASLLIISYYSIIYLFPSLLSTQQHPPRRLGVVVVVEPRQHVRRHV